MNNPRTVKIYLASGSFIRGVAEHEAIKSFMDRMFQAGGGDMITLHAGSHEIIVAKDDFSAIAIRPPRNDDDDDYDDEPPRRGRRR